MNIAVFGLGYVGVVNMACLSKLGHTILGCDIKPHKISFIEKGESPILEPEVDKLISTGVRNKQIYASTNGGEVVKESEMALVCVGTPSDADGTVNLSYCINTVIEIAENIKKHQKDKYTIVFRSTIPPGTIEEKLIPEIELILGPSYHEMVDVYFVPEFLREANAVYDFFNCSRMVIGCKNEDGEHQAIQQVFGFSDNIPLLFVSYRTAEFIKYVDNAYHATKVAFANEVYSIGTEYGVDIEKANEIFLMDNFLNISKRYLKPGLPFGGSCLPKDIRAIINLGNEKEVGIPFFKNVLSSNHEHQQRLLKRVLSYNLDKILIYGLTFKNNTDDVRESPILILARELIEKGKKIKIYDPHLNIENLRIEVPEIVRYIHSDITSVINWSDLIVLNKPDLEQVLNNCSAQHQILNLFNNTIPEGKEKQVAHLYQK